MYKRHLEQLIIQLIKKYRCITLVGPRQSGKTTLSKKLFPKYEYFSFESPDVRDIFEYDPRGFLEGIKDGAIFDEVQKVPKLLSYLQEILDDKKDHRRFILTGSNNLQLSHNVSQTLAGRTRILQVLPFQRSEIPDAKQKKTLNESIFYGSYPRIYDTGLLCYLLRIKNAKQLETHPLRGVIFENLVIDEGVYLDLIEIKSGKTFQK